MASVRAAFQEIRSWTPAIDARAVEDGSLFVLAGKNFVFDAKGPKSAFGSRIIDEQPLSSGEVPVQHLQVGTRSLVFTESGVFERRPLGMIVETASADESQESTEWFQLLTLDDVGLADQAAYRWTTAYVGYVAYINHQSYGLFKLLGDSAAPFTPVGLDDTPIAIAEASGRMILQTRTMTMYSNADDASDLTPALGGAGFQVTAQRVPGDPMALTSFGDGFAVWTTKGILMAEFVGGTAVFRFDRAQTDQLLLNHMAVCKLASGDALVATEHGLFISSTATAIKPLDEAFNEFLRTEVEKDSDVEYRLDYIKEADLLFVQLVDDSPIYSRTFVYHGPSQRWGDFSEPHLGIIRISAAHGDYGYADREGNIRRFHDFPWNEASDRSLEALDSEIVLGYIKPTEGSPTADVNFELQQIHINARKYQTAGLTPASEDWLYTDSFDSFNVGFYSDDDDYNGHGVDSFDVDYNFADSAENYNLILGSVDLNMMVAGQRDFDLNLMTGLLDYNLTPAGGVSTAYIEDWGTLDMPLASDEDWLMQSSLLNYVDYNMAVRFNMDGVEDEILVEPALALSTTAGDLWTLLTNGHYQRIVLSANRPWQKFHVTALEISVHYAGRIG